MQTGRRSDEQEKEFRSATQVTGTGRPAASMLPRFLIAWKELEPATDAIGNKKSRSAKQKGTVVAASGTGRCVLGVEGTKERCMRLNDIDEPGGTTMETTGRCWMMRMAWIAGFEGELAEEVAMDQGGNGRHDGHLPSTRSHLQVEFYPLMMASKRGLGCSAMAAPGTANSISLRAGGTESSTG